MTCVEQVKHIYSIDLDDWPTLCHALPKMVWQMTNNPYNENVPLQDWNPWHHYGFSPKVQMLLQHVGQSKNNNVGVLTFLALSDWGLQSPAECDRNKILPASQIVRQYRKGSVRACITQMEF